MTNESRLYEYLKGLAVPHLRAIARRIGVARPTTKSKEALMRDIADIELGRTLPTQRTNRGAPVKDSAFDPSVLEEIRRIALAYRQETVPSKPCYVRSSDRDSTYGANEVCGLFELIGGQGVLRTGRECGYAEYTIDEALQKRFDLREGDFLFGSNSDGAISEIRSVNGRILPLPPRVRFEDGGAGYPDSAYRLEGDNCPMLRRIDFFSPIGKGQRVLLDFPRTADRFPMLLDLLRAWKRHPEIKLILLWLNGSPEDLAALAQTAPQAELFGAAVDAGAEFMRHEVHLAIERAKRLAELGEEVVLVADSLNAIEFVSNGAARLLFGAARKLESGGSLTVLASVWGAMTDPLFDAAGGYLVFTESGFDALHSISRRQEHFRSAAESEQVRLCREAMTKNPSLMEQFDRAESISAFLKEMRRK